MRHRTRPIRAAALVLAATVLAGPAFAAVPAPAPSYVRELLGIVMPLGFMVLALLLVLRLLRRRYGISGAGAHLSVLQILPVGPRERVVLLKTRAGRVLAVGVSAQSVSLIARLEQDDVAIDPDAADAAASASVAKSPLDVLLRR